MDLETLTKANELNRRITDFQEALNCFEWQNYYEGDSISERPSTNPELIIEFDDCDDRSQIKLPMALNEMLVSFLKGEIKRGLNIAEKEFNDLKSL